MKKTMRFIRETESLKKAYRIPCIYHSFDENDRDGAITVRVPGSKSITNRALLLATLAEGTSKLRGVLFSDDSRHFLKCIQELGFETFVDEDRNEIHVTGLGGEVRAKEASLYVGSAGTAARFLAAYLGVSDGIYHMDASEQMRRRPMAPLLESLGELGCEIFYGAPGTEGKEGFFPFTLKSHGFGKNKITIDINKSSQFLSALLIASCLSREDFSVQVEGKHGMSYIDMTIKMMDQFGVKVIKDKAGRESLEEGDEEPLVYKTVKGQHYRSQDYLIEPDVSAACYFYAMVPLLHIPVLVEDVHTDSMQGDIAFLKILDQMGCRCEETKEGVLVNPPKEAGFPGVSVDMSAFSDQAITLAAIAPFADTPTTITGIGHIRLQESDRIAAIAAELKRMGIRCEERKDGLTIYPGIPKPCEVETYDDHRMAMGFSLIGLRTEGIVIKNPDCCRKTFEQYFEVLDQMISSIQVF